MEKPLPSSHNQPLVSGIQKTTAVKQSVSLSVRAQRILVAAASLEEGIAQARKIAATLSRELQRIDLHQLESPYIRETEKKLLALLDTAEETGAVLYFDEADVLFGKRSEVGDAHDRYANLETSYVLEQIENYPGTVIVATAQPSRLDPELLRKHAFTERQRRKEG